MTTVAEIGQAYDELMTYREGAHFCKMDLHTHSPASECSSFRLPAVLEDAIDGRVKALKNKAGRDAAGRFLDELKGNGAAFDTAFGAAAVTQQVRVGAPPQADKSALKRIADAWLGALAALEEGDAAARKSVLVSAFRDIHACLAGLFFPEEFVMRCYLEGLEIVALTDHNHPGYIVPRVPELGTWFGALGRVNALWRKDIADPRSRGGQVRLKMLQRLAQARKRLQTDGAVDTSGDRATRGQHPDRPKALHKLDKRLAHVAALELKWSREGACPRPLTLLPGTEITVSNVHVLTVFPPTWYVPGRIAGILNDIGILEHHWGRGFEAAASASVQTTLELVQEAGGIAIPAHSNSEFKGLLRLFKSGLALSKVLRHPALVALETTGGTVLAGEGRKRGKDACESLRQLDQREHKQLCFTKGSDAHECRVEFDGTGEDLGARFTCVKADLRPNDTPAEVFRALQLALRSGYNRVVEYPPEDGYNYRGGGDKYRIPAEHRDRLVRSEDTRTAILGLEARGNGSYAGDIALRFSPHLNTVIGSGGKSTIVRLLGYAFGAIGFWPRTQQKWLPELVRAYWREQGRMYCVERRGRSIDPNGPGVAVQCYGRGTDGSWLPCDAPGGGLGSLGDKVILWPGRDVQDGGGALSDFEADVIGDLLSKLETAETGEQRPLLVNQPKEIFGGERLFREVLSRPLIRGRQIIWSTGSPNVPIALDAEKVLVTGEKRGGRQMALVCAGDLHEDEIRRQLLDNFEGGVEAFRLRQSLYNC